jgi:hypothetical protein
MAATMALATQHEVTLTPAVKKKLLTKLRVYQELATQVKTLQAAMAKGRDEIDVLREETGEKSLSLDGFKATLVEPVRSKLIPKKLLAQGVTWAMIEAATEIKPGKAYCKISCPGDSDKDED